MTAYVRNVWYMAAWADEIVGDAMLPRTLLGKPWLIWRKADGSYAMIADRCPHRFVPLSMGQRVGDTVQCRYHGLRFDGTGTCVHSPFPGDPPAHVTAPAMPIVEKHRGLWFWPGDPALADPARIPDFSFLDEERGMHRGVLRIEGNYELITDNLMDLTHAEFLHIETFGVNGSIFHGEQTVRHDDDNTIGGAIWNNWDMTDAEPPEWSKPMLEPGAKIDQWLHMRWHAPAAMALTVGLAKAGTQRADLIVPPMINPHIITPETETSSHYFYDHEDNPQAAEMARRVFIEEDEPMIEAAQRALGTQDFWDARPAILKTDAGAIRARRALMQMRKAEEPAAA